MKQVDIANSLIDHFVGAGFFNPFDKSDKQVSYGANNPDKAGKHILLMLIIL